MLHRQLIACFCAIIGLLIIFTGCQAPYKRNVVVSKQSDLYTVEQPDMQMPGESESDILILRNNNSFSSTDGSVNFQMDIHQDASAGKMPLVQVSPHYLTAADAKAVAYALFPNTEFYEAEPELAENYSKSEIQTKLQRWSQYTNATALEALLGNSVSDNTIDIIKSFIENYTRKYESAPDANSHVPCTWELKKASKYTLTEEDLANADLSNDSEAVAAQFVTNDIPYRFTATTRNKSDYKVNMISCYISDGLSPLGIDEGIFTARLCRGDKPTQLQLDAATQRVEALLPMFQLGQWQIDQCYVESREYGEETEYFIYVKAVPVFNGVAALRRPQINSLRSKEGYAPNHYLTDMQFVFAPNGELISFSLFTPLEIQKVVSDNASMIGTDDLMLRAQEHLKLTDSHSYGFGQFLSLVSEAVQCNVTVLEIECGLSRIRMPNTEDAYYYVPSILLKGSSEYIGKDTGKTYFVSNVPEVLAVLNALDGTIINATNE